MDKKNIIERVKRYKANKTLYDAVKTVGIKNVVIYTGIERFALWSKLNGQLSITEEEIKSVKNAIEYLKTHSIEDITEGQVK
jgi:hypothetical protein